MSRTARRPKSVAPKLTSVHDWFAQRGWSAFPFQRHVWAAYANGESGLIHAPTGTGKTLAAFLGPVMEAQEEGAVGKSTPLRVLWITPLRALAADTAASLQDACDGVGLDWKVETRTGDTKASVRARQRDRLPPVLVTTPESLTLFLTREDGRDRFQELRLIVVDEWHELLSSKRGVQTELALARLRKWNPRLRTWGLSATLGNLDAAREALLGVGAAGTIVCGELPKRTIIDSILPKEVNRFP